MEPIRLEKFIDIPVPDDGYSLVAKSVANDGALLFLSIQPARASAVRENYTVNGAFFPKMTMEDAALFRLSILQVNGMQQTIELPPLDVTFPHVDVFPDGKILLAASRCGWHPNGDYDLNAIVFDPKTSKHSHIHLGDGINRACVDALGRIWVAYFDEGVFGGSIGSAGLVCFSERGDTIWKYPPDNRMADCYALNVSNAEAAIFFYTEFPLCRISRDFKLAYWATGLGGCHEFAISETEVLFSGQYEDSPDAAYLGRFEADGTLSTHRVQLQLPNGSALPKGQLLGRGRHMYFFDSDAVYRTSLD
jgi:hypothetical protein